MARSIWDCHTEEENEEVVEEIADYVIMELRRADEGDEEWAHNF